MKEIDSKRFLIPHKKIRKSQRRREERLPSRKPRRVKRSQLLLYSVAKRAIQ